METISIFLISFAKLYGRNYNAKAFWKCLKVLDKMVAEVVNKICGAEGCNNAAQERLITKLGFAARFCRSCASSLVNRGLAFRDIEKERRHGAGVESQGHADTSTNRDGMSGVSRVQR